MDGIEKEVSDKADVIRIDCLTKFGREVAGNYDVKGAPTTLVFDAKGKIVLRHSGIPNKKNVVSAVNG